MAEPLDILTTNGYGTTFEGTVINESLTHIRVGVNQQQRDLKITPNTRLWKGSYATPVSDLHHGDKILVRTLAPGVIESAWVNLVSVRGQIIQREGATYWLETRSPFQPTPSILPFNWTADTHWGTKNDRGIGQPRHTLPNGSFVQLVGVGTPQGIFATRLTYRLPDDPVKISPAVAPVKKRLQIGPDVTSYCLLTWAGNASHFSCPTGQGACGTCNSADNNQAAWPYVLDHCNADNGCTSQCALECGNQFLFYPCGGGTGTWLTVVSVGPCQLTGPDCQCGNCEVCGDNCPHDPCGNSNDAPRIVDLTTPTFARFFDPTVGCFSCTVAIACECTDCTCPY